MLCLNETCFLFLEISSQPGDPVYFLFKKDVTICSLGWKRWAQGRQDPMWDRKMTATAGEAMSSCIKKRGGGGPRGFWYIPFLKNSSLKGWSIRATEEPGIEVHPMVWVNSGLWSTPIICLLYFPNSTSCFRALLCSSPWPSSVCFPLSFHSAHPVLSYHTSPLQTAHNVKLKDFFVCYTCWEFPVLNFKSRWIEGFMDF